jgi:hypothetical protein
LRNQGKIRKKKRNYKLKNNKNYFFKRGEIKIKIKIPHPPPTPPPKTRKNSNLEKS